MEQTRYFIGNREVSRAVAEAYLKREAAPGSAEGGARKGAKSVGNAGAKVADRAAARRRNGA